MQLRILALVFSFMCCAIALQAQTLNQILRSAEDDMEEGNIDRMEKKLAQLIELTDKPDSTTTLNKRKEIKIQAYRLHAIYYLRRDSIERANEKIKRIFRLKSTYETDARDPLAYVEQVERVRQKLEKNSTFSVSKKAEEIGLEPANVIVITQEEMIRRGYTHLEELFHDLPGISISSAKGISYSNIYQRGYRSNTATDRTLILVDGVEDNELFTSIAYISRQYALSNIKKVEVVYGPASTIYGSNAFAGVINIITKTKADMVNEEHPITLNADVGYGTWNTRYADVTIGKAFNDAWFSFTGRVFRSDEQDLSEFSNWDYGWDSEFYNAERYTATLKQPASTQNLEDIQSADPSGQFHTVQGDTIFPTTLALAQANALDSTAYTAGVDGQPLQYDNPTDNFYLGGAFGTRNFRFGFQHWQRTEGSASTFTDRVFAGSNNGNIWAVRQTFFSLRYSNDLNNNLSITNYSRYKIQSNAPNARQTQFLGYATGNFNLAQLASDSIPTWETTFFYQLANQFRNELTLFYEPTEAFNMVAGFEFRNSQVQANYITSNEPAPEVTGLVSGEADTTSGGNILNVLDYGLYLQATWKPSDQLILTGGVRIDHNDVRNAGFGTVFNPRLVALYHGKDNNTIFKAIYSEAFKDATNFQKFSTTSNRRLNNPTLEPEKARNIELSWQRKMVLGNNHQFKTEIVAYSSWYSNISELVSVAFEGSTTQQFQANGSFNVQGIQAQGSYQYYNYDLWANYTFTRPTSQGGEERVGDIASHQFNIGVNATYFDDLLNVNVRLNHVGRRLTGAETTVSSNPLTSIDPYTIVNSAFTISGEPLGLDNLSTQLIINNLLGTDYEHPGIRSANGSTFASSIPQESRHFIIRLLYQL